jgi:uncharacterized protein (TIGR00288 family)
MTVGARYPEPPIHAPNAALLIDFDNVTMGIRSDLGKELRSLLSSEIIRGKVAVQRAYADWRRYPQYIVPLSEASIDLIFAPAYGSSKKNATDIRLAIDALELIFTRPEIGTFILLSGDSDFSSLVIKLKEYGKYVIGVGIRESSSDLLVQNCDEYYSYNALAGLVKQSEDEPARKYDPWELVTEAIQRMKRNNDVMRSDRLKQVMQDIDNTFDEKHLGISKFSRFCQEAAQRGLLSVSKLDNGQLEVDLPAASLSVTAETRVPRAEPVAVATPAGETPAPIDDRPPRRGRRGRGGRGRDREEREPREPRESKPQEIVAERPSPALERPTHLELSTEPSAAMPAPTAAPAAAASDSIAGDAGQRLTRSEAFDLVRRAVNELATADTSARASEVRRRARQLLGRDSESLSDRMFVRILKDAHDAGIIDLRRRGDDFEVARAAEAAPVAEQLARTEQAAVAASTPPATAGAPAPRIGMGHRGARPRGRLGAPPADLLSIGVVEDATPPPRAAVEVPTPSDNGTAAVEPKGTSRGRRGRGKTAAKGAAKAAKPPVAEIVAKPHPAPAKPAAKAKRGRAAAKKGGGGGASGGGGGGTRGKKNVPEPSHT